MFGVSLFISYSQVMPPSDYELVFIDEFNDNVLSGTDWWKADDCWMHDPISGDKAPEKCCEKNFYKTDNAFLEDGKLKLVAKREEAPCPDSMAHKFCMGLEHELCDGKPLQYSSGWVHSGNAVWLYGYYEISCKIPEGVGLWPAFWFNGRNPDAYREIDVFEFCGVNTSTFQFTLHQDNNYNGIPDHNYRQNQHDHFITPAHVKFMTYGVLWEKDFVQFFFNRHPGKKFKNKILNEPMHLILNLAVNGCFQVNGKDGQCFANCDTPIEAAFEIDYVKVWQKKDKPQFQIIGEDEICLGESMEFQIVSTQGAKYSWEGTGGLNLTGNYIKGVPGGLVSVGKYIGVEPGKQIIRLRIDYNSGYSEIIEKEVRVVEFIPEQPTEVILNSEKESCIFSLQSNAVKDASFYDWKIGESFYTSTMRESRTFFNTEKNNSFLDVEIAAGNACGRSQNLKTELTLSAFVCEVNSLRISFSPNPALNSTLIDIRFENQISLTDEDVEPGILRIFNSQGKKIIEIPFIKNKYSLNTIEMSAGIYHALYISKSYHATGSFVKD